MREKTFKNTPKGRSEIPERSGEYKLLDILGNSIYSNGWREADNLKEKIKEEHYNLYINFSFIKVRWGRRE